MSRRGQSRGPERRGEHQQERRPRVAQRPARDRPPAERADEPAAANEERLGELREPRHEARREHGPGDEPDRRRCHEQRIHAEHAAGVLRQRGAVEPQSPQRDPGEDHEGQVEAQALAEGPADRP